MAPDRDGELIGQQLGDCLLEGFLGSGGMAEVYRARELALGREVAVKVLPASLARDPGYVERFRTEARRVAALQHPHIVPVYYYSEHDPLLYLVMPILKESLRDRLEREGRLDPLEAIRIASEVASALEAAHEQGLVHLDVKPGNVLLDATGAALLTDFGIAREMSRTRQGGALTLSNTGLPVGTPEYMAPEQLRNENIDSRADIYALGAVLYELLTGRAPHKADTPYQVAALVLTAPISPPSRDNPAIWPALEAAIMTALAANPDDRFQSAAGFAAALTRAVTLDAGTDTPLTNTSHSHAQSVATRRFTRPLEAWWRAQSSRQRWLAAVGVVALLAITLVGGGSLLVMNSLGLAARSGQPASPSGVPAGGVPEATVTAISAALATAIAQHTPGAAATATAVTATAATATAAAYPTATPQSTAAPTPAPTPTPMPTPNSALPLSFSPANLGIVSHGKMCAGQQFITNTGNQTVSWQWQSISPNLGVTLKWEVNSSLSNTWPPQPPQDSGLGSGGSETLDLSMSCTQQSYTVTVQDSLGNTYQFMLTSA